MYGILKLGVVSNLVPFLEEPHLVMNSLCQKSRQMLNEFETLVPKRWKDYGH